MTEEMTRVSVHIAGLHCRPHLSIFSRTPHVTLVGLLKVQRNMVTTARIGVVRLSVKAVTSCCYISLPSAVGFLKFVVSLIFPGSHHPIKNEPHLRKMRLKASP